eukprot:4859359-Prymnesium_polylepis.1
MVGNLVVFAPYNADVVGTFRAAPAPPPPPPPAPPSPPSPPSAPPAPPAPPPLCPCTDSCHYPADSICDDGGTGS